MKVYLVNLLVVLTFGLFQSVKSSQPKLDIGWKEAEKVEGLYSKVIPPKRGDRLPGMVTLFFSHFEPGDAAFGLSLSYQYYNRGETCTLGFSKINMYLDRKKVDFMESCEIRDIGAVKRSIYPSSAASLRHAIQILKEGGDTVKLDMYDLSLNLPSKKIINNLKERYHSFVNQAIIDVGWTPGAGGVEWATVLLSRDITTRTANLKYVFQEEYEGLVLTVSRGEGDSCTKQEALRIADIDETPVRLKRLCSEGNDRYFYQFYTEAGEKYFLDLLLNKKEPIDFKMGFSMLVPSEGFFELYSKYKGAL